MRLPYVFGVVGLLGCGAGWHQPAAVAPDGIPARQQVQVWHNGSVLQWHAVRITPDSVSGVPYFRPVDCDSCRRRVPRAAVDSIRLGNPVAGFWKSVGLVVGTLAAFGVIYCWEGCTSN